MVQFAIRGRPRLQREFIAAQPSRLRAGPVSPDLRVEDLTGNERLHELTGALPYSNAARERVEHHF